MKGKNETNTNVRYFYNNNNVDDDIELRDAFDLFDRDKSGAICLMELKQVLLALNFNPTEHLLRKVMREMDIDRNGSGEFRIDNCSFIVFFFFSFVVEFDEFVKVMSKIYERKFTDNEMRRAFRCFDSDQSGTADLSMTRTIDFIFF